MKQRKEVGTLPTLHVRADVEPKTANEKEREIEVVWTTGYRGIRYSWTGKYYEELSLDPAHVNMERLSSGNAPVLSIHDQRSLSSVLGVVTKAWVVDGKEGRAILRFADTPDVEPIWQKVKGGILRNVSVGYNVAEYEEVPQPVASENEERQIPIYRAVNWTPCELSIVPVGFDPDSNTRQRHVTEETPCTIFLLNPGADSAEPQETRAMKSKEEKENAAPADAIRNQEAQPKEGHSERAAVHKDPKEVTHEATQVERKRAREITDAVRKAKLPDSFALHLIDEGKSVDEARGLIIDKWADQDSKVDTRSQVRVEFAGQDETVTRRISAEEALLHRFDPQKFALSERGKDFRGMHLVEVGRELLRASGVNTRGLSRTEIVERSFMSTSDFPAILANVANKTLRTGYESAPRTFSVFCRESEAPDFKDISRTNLGDAPGLEKVNEKGEVKRGGMSDSKETYALATYGKIIALTRQTIINDDLHAFTRIPQLMGRAAADLESDVVWGILTANAALSDGVALFHATHGNLKGSSGAAPDVAGLGVARAAMRKQKNLQNRPINIEGKFLIVPVALETVAEQLLARDFVSTKVADNNPFKGKLVVIAEPRLDADSATAWYMAADYNQCDTIEYSYLEGQRGAYMETKQGFDVEGVEMKVRLDFAAKAIDYRGLYKNVGA